MTVARTLIPTSTRRPIAFCAVVRRLFTLKWIFIHLGVVLLIVLMMNLGFWQLRRLDEKKAFNSLISARTTQEVVPLTDTPFSSTDFSQKYEWRRVAVSGTYNTQFAVTVVNRSQNGTAGYDTLVPLALSSGNTIFVNRGFVPLATSVPSPPTGIVNVEGYVRVSQTRGTLGAIDSTETSNTEFQRFDIELIGKRITAGNVLPVYLDRISENPQQQSDWPAIVDLPPRDNGPHLSYAMQWFFFSAVAATAWGVVIRKRLRQPSVSADSPTRTSV